MNRLIFAIIVGVLACSSAQATFIDSVEISNTPLPVTQSGTWNAGRTWSLLSSTDSTTAVQGGTWNLNNISGLISLPTGASTLAEQQSQTSKLASIDTSTALTASRLVDVATATLQSAGNAILTTINTSLSALADLLFLVQDRIATGSITAVCADANINSCGAGSTVEINSKGAGTVIAQHLTADTGWVVIFDTTYDNGVTWIAQSSIDISINDLTNNLKFFQKWGSSLSADRWAINPSGAQRTRLRASTFATGSLAVTLTASSQTFYTNEPLRKNQTYSASTLGVTLAAAATDVFTITGSATKIIHVHRVRYSCTQTTTGTIQIVFLKRSTANSGGTSQDLVEVRNDSSNSAPTATTLSYTANPTLGTLVGNLDSLRILAPSVADDASEPVKETSFSYPSAQDIVLRGTSELFATNLNGATISGGICNFSVWWTEE